MDEARFATLHLVWWIDDPDLVDRFAQVLARWIWAQRASLGFAILVPREPGVKHAGAAWSLWATL